MSQEYIEGCGTYLEVQVLAAVSHSTRMPSMPSDIPPAVGSEGAI